MAKGKNKITKKKTRKGEKHTFLKKEWFTLISPNALKKSIPIGWTCCKRPTGTEVVADFLKGRVAEICYADVTGQPSDICKKVKIVVDEIHGRICATSFYSFELARDTIYEKLKKRHTLFEVITELKSKDGIIFRIFAMLVTSRRPNQIKLNSYAKSSKTKLVRKKLINYITKYGATLSGDNFAHEIITGSFNTNLEKAAQEIIPGVKLQVYKLKTVKRGAIDTKALLKLAKNSQQEVKKSGENKEAVNLMTRENEKPEEEQDN